MKLYRELANWWHLLSAPEEYAEEAGLYWEVISKYKTNIKNTLELGSGGGNNAYHLKQKCNFTLTDLSPEMISISKKINPECVHFVGDMRSIQLNQTFDLVFIHDAIMLMTTEQDLEAVFQVAKKHLKEDGLLFIAPDFFKETFEPSTDHGGHDDEYRSIRYLEWTLDSDPNDHVVETNYAYIMKDIDGTTTFENDQAKEGLFSKKTWKTLLEKTGFEVFFEPIDHSEFEPNTYLGIVGIRR
ncbi:MAG: class I SAM-dependent methyltransferase [Saprospiraceae bacterium]